MGADREAIRNTAKEREKRKRARYVARTIDLVLRPYRNTSNDAPIGFMTTIGQMKFIRMMLNRVARK